MIGGQRGPAVSVAVMLRRGIPRNPRTLCGAIFWLDDVKLTLTQTAAAAH